MPFLDIILFAAVAAFLFFRLRGILGRRTEIDRPTDSAGARGGDLFGNVVPLRRSATPPPVDDTPLSLAQQIERVRAADGTFREETFQRGARMAFEMIVSAFARGDHDTLRPLLGDQVYASFSKAIRVRAERGETLETRIERIDAADIIQADLERAIATITVRFISQQVNITRDAAGTPLEGSSEAAVEVTDLWVFQRDLRNPDPNWALIATRSA